MGTTDEVGPLSPGPSRTEKDHSCTGQHVEEQIYLHHSRIQVNYLWSKTCVLVDVSVSECARELIPSYNEIMLSQLSWFVVLCRRENDVTVKPCLVIKVSGIGVLTNSASDGYCSLSGVTITQPRYLPFIDI